MSRRPTGSPVVRYGARANARSLDVMRWGLVPFWAKDIKVGFANINARAEGSRAKPHSAAEARAIAVLPADSSLTVGV